MLAAIQNQSPVPPPPVTCVSSHLDTLLWDAGNFTWSTTNGGQWEIAGILAAATAELGPAINNWNQASVRPTTMHITVNIANSTGMSFPTTLAVAVRDTSANVLGTANISITGTGLFTKDVTLNWGGSGGGDAIDVIRLTPNNPVSNMHITCIQFVGIQAPILARYVSLPATGELYSVNLKTYYETLYPVAVAGDFITLILPASSLLVGSTSHTVPAVDTGTWATGVNLGLVIVGATVRGAGSPGSSSPARGGTALKVRVPITITTNGGYIQGGGGGGATTNAMNGATGGICGSVAQTYKSGGGGGAGSIPGSGDVPTSAQVNYSGQAGNSTTGGLGGNPYSNPCQPGAGCFGGKGGNLGAAGSNSSDGVVGGAAGYSIDGIANVTWAGSIPATLAGPTV